MKKIIIILALAISGLCLSIYMDIANTYNVLPLATFITGLMFIFIGLSELSDKKKISAFIHFSLSTIAFITFIYLIF